MVMPVEFPYEPSLIEVLKDLAVDSGMVSVSVPKGSNTLTDTTKDWTNGVHKNRLVKIVGAAVAGAGQLAVIADNSRNTLVIKGSWPRAVGAGAAYVILEKDLAQILRDVLGGGSDISAVNPLQVYDPLLELSPLPGTFAYLDAGGEQTIFTFTPGKDTKVHNIWLDLVNLTQNTTIRLKHQIDGVNYRTFEAFDWTTGMDDGVYFRDVAIAIGRALQVTIQETADEGADRDIPYYFIYEER